MRLDDALRQAREQLAASPSPGLDAELLLCRVIGESRTYLRTWPERTLSDSQQRVFQALVRRRAEGEVGLLITEGTTVGHPGAPGHDSVPAFHGEAALNGWKEVVRQVHAANGAIIPQLWHVGGLSLIHI